MLARPHYQHHRSLKIFIFLLFSRSRSSVSTLSTENFRSHRSQPKTEADSYKSLSRVGKTNKCKKLTSAVWYFVSANKENGIVETRFFQCSLHFSINTTQKSLKIICELTATSYRKAIMNALKTTAPSQALLRSQFSYCKIR